MERDVDCCIEPDESPPLPHAQFDGGATAAALSCSLTLDRIGEVLLFLNSDGLSWKSLEPLENDDSTCLGITFTSKVATEIKFSDVYSVELISHGLIHVPKVSNARRCLSGHHESEVQVYRFTVHGFQQSKTLPSLRVLAAYTFGHNDLQTCQMWVDQINASLALEQGRPKNLLVFVHPKSGKGNGCKIWDSVAPIFSHAKVKTKVIVTQRSGHAYDMMASIGNKELASYDGVIAIGGDGFFNEILNGFLSSRHKAPYPPTPSGFLPSDTCHDSFCVHDPNETVIGTSSQNIEQSPLLPSPIHDGSGAPVITDEDPEFPFPNEHFRFGIIPAGSTDAIVMCTTGARDPITSTFHIVLGKRVSLDVAQVVRWKTTSTSKVEPFVRYAASFAGYGFYGDVITESEKYRWMGPKRYDYAGTRVFLKHRSYEAEVAYIEVKPEGKSIPERGSLSGRKRPFWSPNKSDQAICRVNCKVCSSTTPCSYPGETKWSISKGKFLSIGAAVISNRNERAPDGLVADAHLSDGFMHLILIKDCSHALYLWHLTQLAKKGGNPFDFKFVEHHKTTAFTFTSSGNESVWNLDGELFQAHQLSAQVFRGLVSLFASGPEI
ncbi:ceramide kinase isoform X4 [Malus sylvestris]|uniref:ceramide kinase isoform X1 n=1 Tax=Malus sylvestris TaxID=3752 RepID=UPI0021AC8572|nr:ceramide kinase isoform X1 [Malus sylvestris]XP_050156338.1 ceramide kinase isoform X3 [Malus sylvestris]XP_050156342.1 ceramide kinase isoform X4 [Malus sylvestris]